MIRILQGNCMETLKTLESESINTCVTSPPYWGLRDYNGEKEQLGLEATPQEFVDNLVAVFREVKRVLRKDGTLWLNLGDSYKKSNLVGIPWRVALAMQEDGWYLRQDIIWHKPNPMPESVKNRCTKAHEYIFLLSKSPKYYYDNEAIKEDAKFPGGPTAAHAIRKGADDPKMQTRGGLHKIGANPKRNKRSVWTITTKPFKGAHFATFPKDLIEPCVLAGCPEKMCCDCGEPYQRQMKKTGEFQRRWSKTIATAEGSPHEGQSSMQNIYEDLGLQKQCYCETNKTKAGVVLDPFGGSGTTAQVANDNQRDSILCELSAEYIEIAKKRLHGMFTDITVETTNGDL